MEKEAFVFVCVCDRAPACLSCILYVCKFLNKFGKREPFNLWKKKQKKQPLNESEASL